jgi:hypothetical protein
LKAWNTKVTALSVKDVNPEGEPFLNHQWGSQTANHNNPERGLGQCIANVQPGNATHVATVESVKPVWLVNHSPHAMLHDMSGSYNYLVVHDPALQKLLQLQAM